MKPRRCSAGRTLAFNWRRAGQRRARLARTGGRGLPSAAEKSGGKVGQLDRKSERLVSAGKKRLRVFTCQ